MPNPNSSIKLEHFKSFFDLSADILCIAGFDGYFKYVNHSLVHILEYSKEELYNKPIDSFIHPEDVRLTQDYRKSIKGNNSQFHIENRYVSKSGKIIWFSWTAIPKQDEQFVFAIAKDITHVKMLEQERSKKLKDLHRKLSEIKQSNFSTSHDLRSPVNNIISLFTLIDTVKIVDNDVNEFLRLIKMNADELKKRLDHSVDKLIHEEFNSVVSEDLNLHIVLEHVLGSIKNIISDARATFKIDFNAYDEIYYPKDFLESILLNLITNSIKYRQPNQDPIIEIRASFIDGKKSIIYKDNGLGFDVLGMKDKLFKIKQNSSENSESKGVGLYLIYNYINSMGGEIFIESSKLEGSTFTIIF